MTKQMTFGSVVGIWLMFGAAYGAEPTTNPDTVDSRAITGAQIIMLQKQVVSLEKQLADANARCQQLRDENASLTKKIVGMSASGGSGGQPIKGPLGSAGTLTPAQPMVEETELLVLPAPTTEGTHQSQKVANIVNGAALKITLNSDAIITEATDSTHLTLSVCKISQGLGIKSTVVAGRLWLDSSALMIQATDNDAWTEVVEALKYASLDVQNSSGQKVKCYRFSDPQQISLPLKQISPIRLTLPPNIASKVKFDIPQGAPTGWSLTTGEDGALVLSQSGLTVRIKYDPAMPGVSVYRNNDGARSRLQTINTAIVKANQQINNDKIILAARPSPYSPPSNSTNTVADKNQAQSQILELEKELKDLEKQKADAQRDLDAARSQESLGGTAVFLKLPNGINAAKITLEAGDAKAASGSSGSAPPPTVPDAGAARP